MDYATLSATTRLTAQRRAAMLWRALWHARHRLAVDTPADDARSSTCRTRPRAAARRSTTRSCSCRRRAARRSPRSTPSAARSTTWSTRSPTRRRGDQAGLVAPARWRRPSPATPTHPVMQALMPRTANFGIEARHLQAVIDGCQMDLDQTRYLDFPALAALLPPGGRRRGRGGGQHLRPHRRRRPSHYAHRLGLAMQLTNIIRDVGDDARRGRIYLPVENCSASTSRRTKC